MIKIYGDYKNTPYKINPLFICCTCIVYIQGIKRGSIGHLLLLPDSSLLKIKLLWLNEII
ncbi:hypothetical protein HMPREF1987_01448 [Peptostreptococcaceae bacterium oral taxon 113 str. W5053]|nr:hypothetical protein HMPREF1987_01448 [Peptostreptococcaceae bacterium oral taxon 113 str. W5053]